MTDDQTPSTPQKPTGGVLRPEQWDRLSQSAPDRDDASRGRTAARGAQWTGYQPEMTAADPGLRAEMAAIPCGEQGFCGVHGHHRHAPDPDDAARDAAFTELVRLGQEINPGPDNPLIRQPEPEPHPADVARHQRWKAVITAGWDLDPRAADEITAAAIREADEEHTGMQLACAQDAARAQAHLKGVAAEADGWQRKYEHAAAAVLRVLELCDDADRRGITSGSPFTVAAVRAALNQAGGQR